MSTDATTAPLTQMLQAASAGDPAAGVQVWRAVYDELRRMAASQMAGRPDGFGLQPTALVHEAFLRLAGRNTPWDSRRHFFGAAARAMRQIRVDVARRSARRAAPAAHGLLENASFGYDQNPADLVAVHEVLDELEHLDMRKAEVVSLRYFAGLSVDETADLLGISPRTVDSEWRFARAWLHRRLTSQN